MVPEERSRFEPMIISSRWKKGWSVALSVLLFAGISLPAPQTASAAATNDNIVISQVYGGGGNSGALYKNDFIELYNPTGSQVDLSGWKVRYAAADRSLQDSTIVTPLTGSIPAGGYYLIQEAAGNAGTVDLPAPNVTGAIAMGGSAGKVDLLNATGTPVDLVGYGTASTSSEGTPTGNLSSTLAAIRNASAVLPTGNRGLDTNNNVADFTVAAPAPRNSSYVPPTIAGAVTASPASGAVAAGTNISLSSSTVGASVYAAVYGSGGSEAFKLYTAPIAITENTAIKAYASASGMSDSAVTTFNYTLLDQNSIAGVRKATAGSQVQVEGIVTFINGAETYIQDESGGIVLYNFPSFASVGDRVSATGIMSIYRGLQELTAGSGLPYSVVVPNAGVPQSKLLTASDLSAANGEEHEAELVSLENITITAKSGSTVTASQGGSTFTIYSPSAKLTVGATFDRVTGVIKQFDTVYQLIPLSDNDLVEDTFSVMASPAAGKIITGSKVSLSSPTAGAAVYYTLDGSTPTMASLLYNGPITVNENLTIKAVVAANGQVSDVYTFAYIASTQPRIHNIQGRTHTSEYKDQTVTDIEGVVTQYGYTFATGGYKGFFIQDNEPDNDPATSEGIFVYTTNSTLKPNLGDLVKVSGTVNEYNEGSSSNLTSTQITLSSLKTVTPDYGIPAPVVLGKNGRVIPSTVIDDDGMSQFQPETDAIDFFESIEGMLVKLPVPTILSPLWTSGSANSLLYNIPVRVDNDSKDVVTPAGGLVLKEDRNYNPQRILLSYGDPGVEVGTGDKFNADIIGAVGYNNGNYKVIPAQGQLPSITASTAVQETTAIVPADDKLMIASYNIENYYPGTGTAKIQKLAESIANNMKKPDIIGVVEMQDADGPTNSNNVDADAAALIDAIIAAGGPAYTYTDIAPDKNQDGGQEGGNIRVGFLYNSQRVQLSSSVNGQKGNSTTAVAYDASTGQLTYNPGRIDPANTAFLSSRKPLAAQFTFNGEQVIVIANHFNSKTGDNGPFGSIQPPVLSSEAQRHQIAQVVNSFVKDVLSKNPQAKVVALGDLNDFQFTQTAALLKGNELTDLIDTLPLNEQYTYTYDGNSQVLDHILASKNIATSAKVDVVHLNADFPESRGRVSDHDPVVAQFDLNNFDLRVLHTNDTHGHLESIAKRTTAIKQERNDHTLLLDAGDVFSGTLYSTTFKGMADVSFMNDLGYDAMTFGNHEFDLNKDHPEVLKSFVEAAEFPFASSNIDFTTNNSELASLYHNDIVTIPGGATEYNGNIYPSVIKSVYGEKVGIFGLTTEDTVGLSSPGDKIKFLDHIESAKKTVAALEARGVNKIIAVTHLGYTVDVELAKAVPGIDIIVGGHSHTKIDNPPEAVVNVGTGKNVLVVQTGEYSQYLGKLDVTFDKKGEVLAYNGKLLDVSKYADDPSAKAKLASEYDSKLNEVRKQVVGYSNVDLYTNRMVDGKSVRVVRQEETPIGNMIADSIAEKVRELMPSFVSAGDLASIKGVVAIQNGGGIRAAIDKGDITMGEVLTTLPFNNSLVALKVTGQEIISSLENSVSGLSSDQGRFAQVAGMRYTFDSTKKPEIVNSLTGEVTQAGERMISVDILQANGSYAPIDPKAYYLLSTNSFMAGGGDFYRALAAAKADGRYYELGLPDFEVLLSYLKNHASIEAKLEGRITDLKGKTTDTPQTPYVPQTPADSGSPKVTTISNADLTAKLTALPAGTNELVIPLEGSANGAQVKLPGSVLLQQAAANPEKVLTFTTGAASYSLPLGIMNAKALKDQLGSGDFTVIVSVLTADTATQSAVSQAAAAGSITIAAPVIEFTVTASTDKSSVPLDSFGSTYVKRSITAPAALDPQNATAVTFDPVTGKLAFVPSVFTVKADGTTEITILRNSNSYYTVVKSNKTYGDIGGHWARSTVDLLASKLIITGTSNTAFSPEQSITRAEFAALVIRSLGLAPVSGKSAFRDVNASAWYADVVNTAAAAGLISGYEDGSFKPDSPVTRQEIALVLSKAMKFTGKTLNANAAALAKFKDSAFIPAWSRTAVSEMAAEGIVQGNPDGSFAPELPATRAEAATMLERALKSLKFID